MAPYTQFLNSVAYVMAAQNLPPDEYGRVFLELLRLEHWGIAVIVMGLIICGEIDESDMRSTIPLKVHEACEKFINEGHRVVDDER